MATMSVDAERFEVLSEVFAVLGDPVRLRIIRGLTEGRHNVTELCGVTGMRQQAVSHHLTIMRLRQLVVFDREGKKNFYSLTESGRAASRMVALVA